MRANNQAKNRIKNRNLILRQIIISEEMSRVSLTEFTGLSKMTVTNIVGELIEDGYIQETHTDTAKDVGRNPMLISPTENHKIMGIYINRDGVEAVLGDICGNIYKTCTQTFSKETRETLSEKIISVADEIASESKDIIGIGVSSIGPVNSDEGTITAPPNFFGIKDFNIKSLLKKRFEKPVYVDNDMNTSALAEKYWGRAKNVSDFIYMGSANGIGAGVVINYKLASIPGEVGHISVDINGKECHCGNRGCLEMYASILGETGKDDADEKCRYLSYGIIALMNIINPKEIFLGHRIPLLGEDTPKKIKDYISGKYLYSGTNNVKISFSRFGMDSPRYGSIAVFVEKHSF